jgi:hypothetical protein
MVKYFTKIYIGMMELICCKVKIISHITKYVKFKKNIVSWALS